MTDFLDRFPPEIDDPSIEEAGKALVMWARTQEVLRNVVRMAPTEQTLYMDPDAMTKVI